MKNTTLNRFWIAAAILMFLLLLPLTSRSAYAATTPGRISGQLVNATHKNTPVPNQDVTLQMAQGQTSKDLATLKTNAQGQFSFPNLATDKTISYAVYLRFQGAQYTSDILTLDSKPQQQIHLAVYDATTDSSKLAIIEATILIQQPDPQKSGLTISEIVGFRNLDTHTYVGSLDASKGKPNALLFALPPNVRQVSLDKGFNGYQQILVNTGFAADAAVPPGPSEFGFSYQLAPSSSTYDFSYRAAYPTVDLSILVPPSLHAASGSLTSKGLVNTNQGSYQLFKTSTLRTDDEVHLILDGLPVSAAAAAPSPPQPPLPASAPLGLAAILLLMLLVLLGTWLTWRARKRRLHPTNRKTSISSKKRTTFASSTTFETGSPDLQRQTLLNELLELDAALEAGTLSKEDYNAKRTQTKARLRSLLRKQEIPQR